MKLLSVGCRALVVFVLALGSVPALAATGDIVQKPGAAGCISNQPADAFPSCGLGLELRLGGGPGVPSVVVSPDGKSVYTAGNGYANGRQASAVAIFDRDSGGAVAQKSGTAGCVTPDGMAGDPPVAGGCAAVPAIAQARALTVSPDAKNVYVVAGNGIVIFDRDASGALVQKPATAGCITDDGSPAGEPAVEACQDGTALQAPISVAVSPDGKNVYVAAIYSSAVAIFDRDTTTGELTQKQGLAGCMSVSDPACAKGKGLSYVRSVKVSPDGKNVYLAAYYGSMLAVLQRNTTTGELMQVSGTAACVSEGGLDTSVYPPVGGACTAARGVRYPYDLTISPDGKNAYVTGEASAVATLDRDPATGSLSQRPGPAACISEDGSAEGEGPNVCTMGKGLARPSAVIVSSDGLSVYAVAGWASSSSGVVAIMRRDPVTGVLTQRAAKAGCVSATGRSNGDDPDTAGFCAIGRALYGGSGVTLSPDGRNVYVTAERGGLGIYDRELDVTAPQTTITAGPDDGSSSADETPTFSFASDEPGATYVCSVDGAPFVSCASPLKISPLAAGAHSFAVRATDIDGNVDSTAATRVFTVTVPAVAPPPGESPAGAAPSAAPAPVGGTAAVAADTLRPVVRGLLVLPGRFAIGSSMPALLRAATATSGATIRFSLSEPAVVKLSFAQRRSGRRVERSCRRATRALSRRPSCARYVTVTPSVILDEAAAGANIVRFAGRLSPSRRLAAGRYRLTLTATDAAGNRSTPKHATLTVTGDAR